MISNTSRVGVEPETHARIAQRFDAFAPTAPVGDPGGLPPGWVHVHAFPLHPEGSSLTYHLLYGERVWVFGYGPSVWNVEWLEPVSSAHGRPQPSDPQAKTLWEPVSKKGDLHVTSTAASLGDFAEQTRAEPGQAFWAPRRRQLLTHVIGPLLGENDPIGFLLRMGATEDTVLPARCYEPTFGAPARR